MRFLMRLIVHSAMLLSLLPSVASAGVWAVPTGPSYDFPSIGEHTILTPIGALRFSGSGLTQARSDPVDAAFIQDGLDTINTEILSLHLNGRVDGGTRARLRAGLGEGFAGFLPITEPTRGQVQDPSLPTNGEIDFPASSFFDVFFDVWVDFNGDGIPDIGEVLSNDVADVDTSAARMATDNLTAIPPPGQTKYSFIGAISELDPEIGTFQAVPAGDVNLYFIDHDRQSLGLAGVLQAATHTVVPEPASVCVWLVMSSLGAGAGWRSKRKRAAAQF